MLTFRSRKLLALAYQSLYLSWRKPVEAVGKLVLTRAGGVQSFFYFVLEVFRELPRRPFRFREILIQMEFIGSRSFGIILLSAFSIGAVFALLIGEVFQTFKAEGVMGIATAKALTRELAPMMTAFLLTGRGGSAITAELATMKVNEQVDAMESMGVSPVHYLVVPRLIGFFTMMPLLSGLFVIAGLIGSYLVGVLVFDVDQGLFFTRIADQLHFSDLRLGFIKSATISVVIALIACWFGLNAKGGAKGVGTATTRSVIVTMLVFLLIDFVFTGIEVNVR